MYWLIFGSTEALEHIGSLGKLAYVDGLMMRVSASLFYAVHCFLMKTWTHETMIGHDNFSKVVVVMCSGSDVKNRVYSVST